MSSEALMGLLRWIFKNELIEIAVLVYTCGGIAISSVLNRHGLRKTVMITGLGVLVATYFWKDRVCDFLCGQTATPQSNQTDGSIAAEMRWDEIRAAGAVAQLEKFVADFPSSQHVAEARARIEDLTNVDIDRKAKAALKLAQSAHWPNGPSFDCKKASSTLEVLICLDSELSEWDKRTAAAYRGRLNSLSQSDRARFAEEQRQWAESRDIACNIVPAATWAKDALQAAKGCLLPLIVSRASDIGEGDEIANAPLDLLSGRQADLDTTPQVLRVPAQSAEARTAGDSSLPTERAANGRQADIQAEASVSEEAPSLSAPEERGPAAQCPPGATPTITYQLTHLCVTPSGRLIAASSEPPRPPVAVPLQ
jgi:uncharacterized protein YecT (DUF1311 family)